MLFELIEICHKKKSIMEHVTVSAFHVNVCLKCRESVNKTLCPYCLDKFLIAQEGRMEDSGFI